MIILPTGEQRAYSKRLGPYVIGSLVLFSLGIVAGILIVDRIPQLADHFADTLGHFIKTFAELPRLRLAAAIFLNNAAKTLLAIVLGPVLGIVPAIFLLANGVALAIAMSLSIAARGVWLSVLSIAPHGIIELPAVFLGTSIGLMLGIRTIAGLRRGSQTSLKHELIRALRYYCTVIAPLLFVAAIVEAFLTSALVAPR
jgi:stage II sporulation protein M